MSPAASSALRSEELRDALFRYHDFAAIARDVWRTGRDEFPARAGTTETAA